MKVCAFLDCHNMAVLRFRLAVLNLGVIGFVVCFARIRSTCLYCRIGAARWPRALRACFNASASFIFFISSSFCRFSFSVASRAFRLVSSCLRSSARRNRADLMSSGTVVALVDFFTIGARAIIRCTSPTVFPLRLFPCASFKLSSLGAAGARRG